MRLQITKVIAVVALVVASYVAGVATPTVSSQAVANLEQRTIRAQEQQAQALKQIAQAVRKLERCQ